MRRCLILRFTGRQAHERRGAQAFGRGDPAVVRRRVGQRTMRPPTGDHGADGRLFDPVDGEILVSTKTSDFEDGDIVAFYYNNKILVKRVICGAGDWFNITEDGTVSVNDQVLDEPYITEKSLGTCDIELPYQVDIFSILNISFTTIA